MLSFCENVVISKYEIKKFQSLIKQRLCGKPVSRIINNRHFWKKKFKLNETTLDFNGLFPKGI